MSDKTSELLNPHQNGHPITYNHYFTETLGYLQGNRCHAVGDVSLVEHTPGVLWQETNWVMPHSRPQPISAQDSMNNSVLMGKDVRNETPLSIPVAQ